MAYEAVDLRCSASSELKSAILWMYDGTFSLPSGASVDSLNALMILSANISHSGTYTCNATDAFSSIQTSVTVHVKYPETCSKVKANIIDVSGDYFIDPDGVLGEVHFLFTVTWLTKEALEWQSSVTTVKIERRWWDTKGLVNIPLMFITDLPVYLN